MKEREGKMGALIVGAETIDEERWVGRDSEKMIGR